MSPAEDCTNLIKQFEGCAKKRPDGTFAAYPDPATGGDPWTIGWGSTGPNIKKGTIWTQEECDERFTEHVEGFAERVAKAIGDAPTSQPQFDALVSFAYNVGMANLAKSTLLRKHKAGDHEGAAREFAKWNKAAGKVLPGLTRRRKAEAALYQRGAEMQVAEPMVSAGVAA
jgi:GH24 family phage-related lysozyme (muramidase)